MCGRATLTKDDFEGIARDLDAEFSPDDARLYRPRFNVAPSDLHWIVEAVHDRMPVVVAPAAIDDWLTAEPAQAATLLRPAPDDALVVRQVSKRVGSVKNDDPACLEPVTATDAKPPAQGSLF